MAAEDMRDAAYANNISTGFTGVVAGYLPHGDPFHAWSAADWQRFKGKRKLPIFVRSDTQSATQGIEDAFQVMRVLNSLGAPIGCITALDLETRINPAYVNAYGSVMRWAKYSVLVYGSTSTVFRNPALDGYWVAAPAAKPYLYNHPNVRATQYRADGHPGYDSSVVYWRTLYFGKWWR
jgi:hypothetical protein